MKKRVDLLKRTFDLVATFFVPLLLLPVLMLITLMIRSKLGSPIFFKQPRPGLNGKIFNIYKFRTMTDECDRDGILLSDELRLTKFGKFLRSTSLDELPSLLNVLKSDMSLVGPRPLLLEYLHLYSSQQSRRHEVKPGITGWAQVNGRNAITWSEKFDLDVWYVDNQSIWLDIKILWLTVKKVIIRDGINQVGQSTMENFKGNDNEK
jgi:lipopolysaccharide/colanic/teichoic acid biosynthesis glycosyltransferase